jgi:hypothetical protein
MHVLRCDFASYFENGQIYFKRWGKLKQTAQAKLTLLDFDFPRAPRVRPFFAVAHILSEHIEWIRYDRTRRGWHVIIKWKRKFEPLATVALQAVLGSDGRREALNLKRVLSVPEGPGNAKKKWNLLYDYKLE